ncbi:helix-turn-helix domain-containing protein [Pelistega suis]|uniref:helix-turn-helix domain-containing protein n=1 Tax=Pelistega suis TaxID=1631957 RepID=UPI00211C9BBD|nr:helix-turn-helix domain-containing protein [Pelistega suis]MCQ9328266.1 helix-turn-helix domain-containing protein [Pelistega suis]
MNKNKAIGSEWDDNFDKAILTTEEIVESDLRAALINELIMARKELGISQKQLEVLSGVKQPVIARLELGQSIPQLSTLLKILAPLGKTLAIVPMPK